MKKEIAELWVKELPKYKQGFGKLRSRDWFCCLGVLCRLAVEAGVIQRSHNGKYAGYECHLPPAVVDWAGMSGYKGSYCTGVSLVTMNDSGATLPIEVREWAGISSASGLIRNGFLSKHVSLAGANDSGALFPEIADIIRTSWETL
jgi:hypothetical protein